MPPETGFTDTDPSPAGAVALAEEDGVTDDGLRSRGMRDLGPQEMRRFRDVERAFLDVTGAAGYREIRTPALEPLHLYTASGALSPQLLDRVYSFLDWDGWSGERVVLRPDATVAVARWVAEQRASGEKTGAERLSYVQPAYRFVTGDGDREIWQCGVELFDSAAPAGDVELLLLARELLEALGLGDLSFEIAHAGLSRAVFAAAGLDAAEQLRAYDRMLEGDAGVTDELTARYPGGAAALRLLADVDGTSGGYLANLRAAFLPDVPAAERPLDELAAVTVALDEVGCDYLVLPGTASNFEYYSGVTFRLSAGGSECIAGGRYDGLTEATAGVDVPASGFAADVLRLAALVDGRPS
jgi:histidyl-tRNA synthetase